MGFEPQNDLLPRSAQGLIFLSVRALVVLTMSIGYWLVKNQSQGELFRVRPHQPGEVAGDES